MSKRILTDENSSEIDDIPITNFRVYPACYNINVSTLYAVIIADDNMFEGL